MRPTAVGKSSTILDQIKVERCVLCQCKVEAMLVHLQVHHKGVEKHGEIYWLNRHEAVYAGRLYCKERGHERWVI